MSFYFSLILLIQVKMRQKAAPFAIYILSVASLITFLSFAQANQCDQYLNSESAPKRVQTWALQHSLTSVIKDGPEVVRFSPEQKAESEILANDRGQVISALNQQVLAFEPEDTIMGVWDIQDASPGSFFVAKELKPKAENPVKHSSFNGNQPVIAAWNMTLDYGFITEINDGSGHYMPVAANMYVLLRKLQSDGYDITSTYLNFARGPDLVRELKILALDFIEAYERLTPEEQQALNKIKYNKRNFAFFINFMNTNSDDPFTKNSYVLYKIRTSTVISADLIQKVVSFLEDFETSDSDKLDTLRALFNSKHSRFKDKPSIRFMTQTAQEKYYSDLKTILLSLITNPETKKFVEDWFEFKDL
jgi:hypothetical protein